MMTCHVTRLRCNTDEMLELAFVDDDSYSRQAILGNIVMSDVNCLTTRQGATFDVPLAIDDTRHTPPSIAIIRGRSM